MAKIILDTSNKEDIISVMHALQAIVVNNEYGMLYRSEKDFLKLQEENRKLNEDIEKYKDDIEQLNNKYNTECEEKIDLKHEKESLELKLKELKENNEILNNENNNQKELLEKYTFKGFPSENKFFDVTEDSKLKETASRPGFYKAVLLNDDRYEIMFYDEKAPHNKAIEKKESILEPFCDIQGNIVDGANFVINNGKGIIKHENNEWIMVKKIPVSLIKK